MLDWFTLTQFLFLKFNDEYTSMSFTIKWAGHQSDDTQRLNEFAEMVVNGFNYDPLQDKAINV